MKVKLATDVKGEPKPPFSIATTTKCWEGANTYRGLLQFTLDLYFIILSVKHGGIKYHFLSVWNDDLRLNPVSR